MSKKLKITLFSDGKIQVETDGIKGKKCTDYANFIAQITNAKISAQELKKEYYEQENEYINSQNTQNLYE